jgi:glycerol-3-phosphate dehydrogenase (NAD+)
VLVALSKVINDALIYADRVTMYVFEEMIEGKKLTEIINTTHENVKYLPGHKLPENVVSHNF